MKGAPKGNTFAKGNKGGRRPSAYEEVQNAIWHSEKWEIDSDVPALQAKLKTGKYSVRDVFLAKALQGNERVLSIFANKLLPDLVDHRTNGKDLPTPILPIGYVHSNNGDQQDSGDAGSHTGGTRGDVLLEDGVDALIPDSESASG